MSRPQTDNSLEGEEYKCISRCRTVCWIPGTHLKYKPLSEEERKLVLEKLGSSKIVKFLSNENAFV